MLRGVWERAEVAVSARGRTRAEQAREAYFGSEAAGAGTTMTPDAPGLPASPCGPAGPGVVDGAGTMTGGGVVTTVGRSQPAKATVANNATSKVELVFMVLLLQV